ncbi:hypothetical protein BG011_003842 [Mortierella polycephala]|uniref:Uncharacterized protein n=1 Tax=Mortierella polycephala TaxID=41804 RepID=A0A9P6Q433_9FUNG|nr:hypothetical protein BG011_003842 [Mortierella polycephala]
MRLIKRNDDDQAATEAMRGGAIGAFKYCTVALFAGGVLNAVSPRFRAIKAPQKGWLMVAAFLGGFGNGSDTAFTNFERRDRELQVRLANQKRHEIIYGNPVEKAVAAASLSTPTETTETPSKDNTTPISNETAAAPASAPASA